MSERIYNHSEDCDSLDPFIIKPCNCHYQEIKSLRETVKKLERETDNLRQMVKDSVTAERELEVSLNRYQMDWATHTARIKELEEAMPDPLLLRSAADLADDAVCTPNIQSNALRDSASRIEKVMRR